MNQQQGLELLFRNSKPLGSSTAILDTSPVGSWIAGYINWQEYPIASYCQTNQQKLINMNQQQDFVIATSS